MRSFSALLLVAFATVRSAALAAPAPSPTPAVEHPTRPIVLLINGQALSGEAAPQLVRGRILVPLRTVFGALGIALVRNGITYSARLPSGAARFALGSASASINGRTIRLDAAPVDLGGITYVPLKLVTAALGATASFDQHDAEVDIVSAYIGRNTDDETTATQGGGTNVQGLVAAVDADSTPPSITVTSRGAPRTIAITSSAKIFTEDVTVHSQVRAALGDVRVGDRLSALLDKDGHVLEVHDIYSSDAGTIAAVSPIGIVLQNGHVWQPGKVSEITLDTAPASIGDLKVGDYVTVRRNPETGEVRQMLVSRNVAVTPAASGASAAPVAQPVSSAPPAANAPKIESVAIDATRPLRAGETMNVTLVGTPGGHASFSIGDVLLTDMHETTPGTYAGSFRIPDRFNVTQAPVVGHLDLGGVQAARVQATGELSAATTPPSISDIAPLTNQTVNNARPSIYATFTTPTEIPINTSTISLEVCGRDVTASATRTNSFISYNPGVDYPDGPCTVNVRVADLAGNLATRTWTFTIRTH
jgi:hypothetical protein